MTEQLFATASTYSPLFQQLLARRKLTDKEEIETFLSSDLARLEDPFKMKGMREAVQRILSALENREKILVHGDYDVDGVTATAIVSKCLQTLGADYSTFLPHRAEDGYGVSGEAIKRAHENGATVLITADCGVSATKEMELAHSLGMDAIILDHHRIPAHGLPPAYAILNPLQENCVYPFKELSAGGLAFKLAQALIGDRAFQFLDLTALSTVCDVAPLVHENRLLVKKGLEVLASRKNLGVRFLIESAGVRSREINVGHVGFMLGPRINAAGRMSSPEIALRLLLTDSEKEAQSLAQILEEENKARQREERQVVKEAMTEVEKCVNFNRDRVIVVGREGWHQGVIGIVAARLVDRFHRPAVVIALEDGKGKGSGRSIKGFHLFNALEACKDLFETFGGHEQAAGLSIKGEQLAAFRTRVNEHARETYAAEAFVRKVAVDLEIKLEDFRPQLVRELMMLEPHGAGNPRPVFLTKGLKLRQKVERVGESQKFWVTDGTYTYETTTSSRSNEDLSWLDKNSTFDLAYTVKPKIWDGILSLVFEAKEVKSNA